MNEFIQARIKELDEILTELDLVAEFYEDQANHSHDENEDTLEELIEDAPGFGYLLDTAIYWWEARVEGSGTDWNSINAHFRDHEWKDDTPEMEIWRELNE